MPSNNLACVATPRANAYQSSYLPQPIRAPYSQAAYQLVKDMGSSHKMASVHSAAKQPLPYCAPVQQPDVKSELVNAHLARHYGFQHDFSQLDVEGQKIVIMQAIEQKDALLLKMLFDAPSLKHQQLSQQGYGFKLIQQLVEAKNHAMADILLEQPGLPFGNETHKDLFEETITKLVTEMSGYGETYANNIKQSDHTGTLLVKALIHKSNNSLYKWAEPIIDSFAASALYPSCEKEEMAKAIILRENFDPTLELGYSLLSTAKYGHAELLKSILESKKIDVNQPLGGLGERALCAAQDNRSSSYKAIVDLLMEHGANPNLACTNDKCTPLHSAAITRKSMVKFLLQQPGIQINPLDKDGKTPLTYAREYGFLACGRAIKRAGGYDPEHISLPRRLINANKARIFLPYYG